MIAFMTRACRNKLKLPSFSGVVCTGTHIWDLEIVENYKDFYGKFIREQVLLSGEIVIHSGHDSKSHESFHFHAITPEMDNLGGVRDGAVERALASHQCGPGSNPGVGAICGLGLFDVGSLLCSERFFSGYSGFPLSSKTNISKFQFNQE